MDTRTQKERSRIMAAVHSRNTGPELLVRRFLWSKGIRYRLHVANVPGTPDISLSRCKLAIFVHGCFWHGHVGCPKGRLPKTRLEYWGPKIDANMKRDVVIAEQLNQAGWHQLVIWECQLRTRQATDTALTRLWNDIRSICPDIGSA